MRVVGLDLSLTSTGIAVIDGDRVALGKISTSGKATATLAERWLRLDDIATQVEQWVGHVGQTALVVVEGPSMGQGRQGGTHDRAGLWWLVMDRLHGQGHKVVEVPPSVRAKYATGAGNAGKDAVLAAVCRRYPSVEVTGNDTADALVLASMGARHLGFPLEGLPQTHLQAMGKVRWPVAAGVVLGV